MMKKTGIVATILFLLMALFSPWSGAEAADSYHQLSEVTTIPTTWVGTDADRLKDPIPAPPGSAYDYEYDYTYGDEASLTYTLPWAFSFYGQTYTSITADTNGNIWFSATDSAYSFNLANTGRGPVIAAWHNDLSSYYYGGVFVQHKTNPERVVIEWRTETYSEEGYYQPNSFEVVLFSNGDIRFDYGSFTTTAGADAGSGISKGDGSHYLNISTLYANVFTLAGRSFAFADLTPPPLTTNPVPPVTNASSQTLSGTMEEGAIITVTSNSGAVVGTVTYPTSTTWQIVITGLAVGDNTFTITATDIGGISTVTTIPINYIPQPLSLSLSTASIAADYKGAAGLAIENLTATGAEVLVEQLVDANRNGSIDSGDYVIRSFKVTDGIVSTNPNVPGDTDGAANKAVTTALNYFLTSDLYHAPGNYLLRVTSGSDTAVATLNVTPVSQPQTVSGAVSDGTNPLPGAMVRVTDKWQRPVAFAIADAAGQYTVDIKEPGDYYITPSAYGFATGSAQVLTGVAAGQSIVGHDLTLTPGVYHLTGQVKDETTLAGIGGVWVTAGSADYSGVAMTAANGSYDLLLPAGNYAVAAACDITLPNSNAKGYLCFAKQAVPVNLTAAATAADLTLIPAGVFVSGKVQDASGQAVPGLPVQATLSAAIDSREPVAYAVTNAGGDYTLGIFAGTGWDIALNDPAAQTLGYLGTHISGFSTATSPLTGNNLTAYPVTAWVQGTVRSSTGFPLAGKEVRLRDAGSTIQAAVKTAGDGTYRLGAYGGNWFVVLNDNHYQALAHSIALDDGQTSTADMMVFNVADKIGVFRGILGEWYLDTNGNGAWEPVNNPFSFGAIGDVPVSGDWTGSGTTRIGVYRSGTWYLDLNGNNVWDNEPTDRIIPDFGWGMTGAVPVTGDWTGSGTTKVGVYQNGIWYLDLNGNGVWDDEAAGGLFHNFGGGLAGAVPVTGDWTGSGTAKVGVYQNGIWYLDLNGNGVWDDEAAGGLFHNFGGGLGGTPVTGDWTGNGITKFGVFKNGFWYLDQSGNGIWNGGDNAFAFSSPGDIPVTGDWNGDGRTKFGAYYLATAQWHLDMNGNGAWDGTPTDAIHSFGYDGFIPVMGDWNGDGKTEIGVYDPAAALWYLDMNGNRQWDGTPTDALYSFGYIGVIPVTGDWNGDGNTEIGVFDPVAALWYRDMNGNGQWDGTSIDKLDSFGYTGVTPVTGDWNGSGTTKIGVFDSGTWYLDLNGNGTWDAADDIRYFFGVPGDKPLTGKW